MLSSFRDRFGTAGLIVAIVALVAALAGGAYAASGSLTGKQKKEVKAIAKSFQGTGPAGPVGAAGPRGPAGINGKDGAPGPTGPTGSKGKAGFPGLEGEVGPTGEAGPTGPTGSFGGGNLPEGVTETGYWAFKVPGVKTIKDGDGNMVSIGTSEAFAQVSFPERLSAGGAYTVRVQNVDPEFTTTCGTGAGGAGGTLGSPKAPAGSLCVWMGLENAAFVSACAVAACSVSSVNNTGGFLKFNTVAEGPARGVGTWAVTG